MSWPEWTVSVLVAILCTSQPVTGGPVCYQCHNISVPEHCNVSVTCQDHHQCFVEETIDDTFAVRFNLGCETYGTCQSVIHSPDPVGKRWVPDGRTRHRRDPKTTCFKCCNKDFCNLSNCAGLCHINPCLNGGTCTSHRNNDFTCHCISGHFGVLCEIAVDHCKSNPCENGGTCLVSSSGYGCICHAGYTGDNCQTAIKELVCLQCQWVSDPVYCNHEVKCQQGQKCYTEAVQSGGRMFYNLGCGLKQTCDFYDQLLGRGIVGRRAADITRCYSCCNETLCNNQSCIYASAEKSCHDYYRKEHKDSGIYQIDLRDGLPPFSVYCDMLTPGEGWVVFQRRIDGTVDFYRNWTEYRNGFGDIGSNFWLGDDKLHRLTKAGLTHLRVDLGDWENRKAYAEYTSFTVGDETSNYVLQVSGYSGTAGDAMGFHNGQKFTTYDVDYDASVNDNCASYLHGAWWYAACHASNLNGLYARGVNMSYVIWHSWQQWTGLKFAEMKVR